MDEINQTQVKNEIKMPWQGKVLGIWFIIFSISFFIYSSKLSSLDFKGILITLIAVYCFWRIVKSLFNGRMQWNRNLLPLNRKRYSYFPILIFMNLILLGYSLISFISLDKNILYKFIHLFILILGLFIFYLIIYCIRHPFYNRS